MNKKLSVVMLSFAFILSGCAELNKLVDSLKPTPLNTTAANICKEFDKNPTRAKETYVGKYLQSAGKLSIHNTTLRLNKDDGETIFIDTNKNVTVHVSNYPKSKVLKLNNGDKVSALGKITNIDSIVRTCYVRIDYYSD